MSRGGEHLSGTAHGEGGEHLYGTAPAGTARGERRADVQGSTCAVEVGSAGRGDLLVAGLGVEHGGPRGSGPGEVQGPPGALRGGDAVLQRALVERVGREAGQGRVHAVLYRQAGRLVPQRHQSLEQRCSEARLGRLQMANSHAEKYG